MPSLFTLVKTGLMTKKLMNIDSPASTWFGGTDVNPSAFRVIDKTTKILVKLVISSSNDGATETTVSSSRIEIDVLGLPPTSTVSEPLPPAVDTVGLDGAVGACSDGSLNPGS